MITVSDIAVKNETLLPPPPKVSTDVYKRQLEDRKFKKWLKQNP